MNPKQNKNTVTGLLVLIIIISTALAFLLTGRALYAFRARLAKNVYQSYLSSGKKSDLLQVAILDPKAKSKEVLQALIEEGDYSTAQVLNIVFKDSQLDQKIAEDALFNFNYTEGDKYLTRLAPGEARTELMYFKTWLQDETPHYDLTGTETNAGKLMAMVQEKDFRLATLDNALGEKISINNQKYPKPLENRLAQVETLTNARMYFAALSLLDDSSYSCNTDYYLVKSDLFTKLKRNDQALQVLKMGLVCDPTNPNLLIKAATLFSSFGNKSQANYYNRRIEYLNSLR